MAWLSGRWHWFSVLVKAEPTLLLLHHDRTLDRAMRQQRVTNEELASALRASEVAAVSDAAAVVLQTDGSLIVIPGEPTAEKAMPILDGVSS